VRFPIDFQVSIINEDGQPAFTTEKVRSWAEHKVGCVLKNVARKCSRQKVLYQGMVTIWVFIRQNNWVFNKLWQLFFCFWEKKNSKFLSFHCLSIGTSMWKIFPIKIGPFHCHRSHWFYIYCRTRNSAP